MMGKKIDTGTTFYRSNIPIFLLCRFCGDICFHRPWSPEKKERRMFMKDVDYQKVFPKIIPQIVKEGAFLVVKGKEKTNVMTIGWATFGFVWRKPVMMVAVRKTRFTHGLLEGADSFTVTVPTGDMKKEINLCGSKSGKNTDKFKESGLATLNAKKVDSPVLKVPGYHFECRIICRAPMDPQLITPDVEQLYPAKDYHTLYFGEILASYQT